MTFTCVVSLGGELVSSPIMNALSRAWGWGGGLDEAVCFPDIRRFSKAVAVSY